MPKHSASGIAIIINLSIGKLFVLIMVVVRLSQNDYNIIEAKVIISFHIIKDLLYEYHLSEKNKAK